MHLGGTVQANWCVIFRFPDGGAKIINYDDYHRAGKHIARNLCRGIVLALAFSPRFFSALCAPVPSTGQAIALQF